MSMVQLIVMLTARTVVHANPLPVRIYSYAAKKSLIPVCNAFASALIVNNININQPHLSWPAAGAWQRTRDITSQHVH